MQGLASFTVTRYAARDGLRALAKMGSDRAALSKVPGLQFYRLLGTGRGASLSPGADFLRWARFCTWSSRGAFEQFEDSPFRQVERGRAFESYTILLAPIRSRGTWGGLTLFDELQNEELQNEELQNETPNGALAVLTRATLRPSRLAAFWRAVPESQRALRGNPDLLASVGFGEAPLLHQGTFSLWRNEESMRAFAHRAKGHRAAMRQTREQGWYAEELFARFSPLRSRGTWNGRDPLAEFGWCPDRL